MISDLISRAVTGKVSGQSYAEKCVNKLMKVLWPAAPFLGHYLQRITCQGKATERLLMVKQTGLEGGWRGGGLAGGWVFLREGRGWGWSGRRHRYALDHTCTLYTPWNPNHTAKHQVINTSYTRHTVQIITCTIKQHKYHKTLHPHLLCIPLNTIHTTIYTTLRTVHMTEHVKPNI